MLVTIWNINVFFEFLKLIITGIEVTMKIKQKITVIQLLITCVNSWNCLEFYHLQQCSSGWCSSCIPNDWPENSGQEL